MYFLAAAVQGWFFRRGIPHLLRAAMVIGALFMIEGGFFTDLIGASIAVGAVLIQRAIAARTAATTGG